MVKVWEFLPEFVQELRKQLEADDKRWGDTWLQRKPEGQTERIELTFKNYFDQYRNVGTPVNWLKVAGEALICWIRESYPAMWED